MRCNTKCPIDIVQLESVYSVVHPTHRAVNGTKALPRESGTEGFLSSLNSTRVCVYSVVSPTEV